MKLALSPAAMAAGCDAVTMAPLSEMFQPAPAALTNVSPAGSVSRRETVPDVGAVPRLRTVNAYDAFWPTVNATEWCLSRLRSGMPSTWVGSTSRPFDGSDSPAVVAVAALVTPG